MAMLFFCEFPDHLWFDVDRDVWIEPLPDGRLRLGMTDPAQTRSGRILHVRARPGKRVQEGKSLATVESGKWVGPFPSPVDGTVVAINPAVLQDPNVINRDPYGAGWLVELRPQGDWHRPGVYPAAEAVEVYRPRLKEAGLTCLRCVEPSDSGTGGGSL